MIKLEINKNTKVGMEFNKLQKFYWSEKLIITKNKNNYDYLQMDF
jgi:hypothetical protein